jgi:hypothetical protein
LDLLSSPMKRPTPFIKGRPLKATITRKPTQVNDAYSPMSVSAYLPARLPIVSIPSGSQQEQSTVPHTIPVSICATTAIQWKMPPMTHVHKLCAASLTVQSSPSQPNLLLPTDVPSSPQTLPQPVGSPQKAFSGPVMMDAEPTPPSAHGPSFSSVSGPGFSDLLVLAAFTSSQASDPLTRGISGFQSCPPLNDFGFMPGVSDQQSFSRDESSYMELGTVFLGDSNLIGLLRPDPHSSTLMPTHGCSTAQHLNTSAGPHLLPTSSRRNISCSRRVKRGYAIWVHFLPSLLTTRL